MFLYRERKIRLTPRSTLISDVSKKAQDRSDRLTTIEGLDLARQINSEEDNELKSHREELNNLNNKIAGIRARKTPIDGTSQDPQDLINSIERNEEAKRKEINELLKQKDKTLSKIRDIRDKYNFKRRENDLLDNADIEALNRFDLLLQRQSERIKNNDQLFVELRDKIKSQKIKEQAINFQRLKELRFIDFMEAILDLQNKGSHGAVFNISKEVTEEDEHAKVLFSILYEKYSKLVASETRTPGEINILGDNPPITNKEERERLLSETEDEIERNRLQRKFDLEDILYAKETTLSSQIAARIAMGDESIQYSETLVNEVKQAIDNLVQKELQPRTPIEEKVQELYNNSINEDGEKIGERKETTIPSSIKDLDKDIQEAIEEYTKLFNDYMLQRFDNSKSEVISKLKERLKKAQRLSENQMFLDELLTSGLNGKMVKETVTRDGKQVDEYYFIPELQSGMYIDESEKNFYEFATYPDGSDTKIYNVEQTDTPGYYNVTLKDPEYRIKMDPNKSRQIEVYSSEQLSYKDNLENALKLIRNQKNRIKKLRRQKASALQNVTDNSENILNSLNEIKTLMEEQIPGFKEFIENLEESRASEADEKAKKLAISQKEKQDKIDRLNKEREEKIASVPLVPVDNLEAVQKREEIIQEINNEHVQKVEEINTETQEDNSVNLPPLTEENASYSFADLMMGFMPISTPDGGAQEVIRDTRNADAKELNEKTIIARFIKKDNKKFLEVSKWSYDAVGREGSLKIVIDVTGRDIDLSLFNIDSLGERTNTFVTKADGEKFKKDVFSILSKIQTKKEESFSSNYPESFEETKEQQEASQLYSDILQFFNVLPKSVIDSKKTHLEKQINDLDLSKIEIEAQVNANNQKLIELVNNKQEVEKAINETDKKKLKKKLTEQLNAIDEAISSIKNQNLNLKKNQSKIVGKIHKVSKALSNYDILSEISLNNLITVSELKTKLRDYNEELVNLKNSLTSVINKNEEVLAQLKELRTFYNSFKKNNISDVNKINSQLEYEFDRLTKTGYLFLANNTSSAIPKRDYEFSDNLLNFYEHLQHFTNSKRYSTFEYQTMVTKLEDIVSYLTNLNNSNIQNNIDDPVVVTLLNNYKNLHDQLSKIIAQPTKKVRAKFTKTIINSLVNKPDDFVFDDYLTEHVNFLIDEKAKSLSAIEILENIEKLQALKESYNNLENMKSIIVDKADTIRQLNPSLEIDKITSITKLNKVISSLSKKITELEKQQDDVNNRYKKVSKDTDTFFKDNVIKDILEYRKSLRNALNGLKLTFTGISDNQLDNPVIIMSKLVEYLNNIDNISFISEETDVDKTINEQNEKLIELQESNKIAGLKLNDKKDSVKFAYDSILTSLEDIRSERESLNRELNAIDAISEPTLQDLWVLRKKAGDTNPTETEMYFNQIETLSNQLEETENYINSVKEALQTWVKYLDISDKLTANKSKSHLDKLQATEKELLGRFGLTEQFESSGKTNVKDFINDAFKQIISLSPELLDYDKILGSDFSQITEDPNSSFKVYSDSIPKLELELSLLKEAYGDIDKVLALEKQDRLKTGKKEVAELAQEFNKTHTPIVGDVGIISNSNDIDSLSSKEDVQSLDLSNLIVEQNLKPLGTLITSAYDVEYTLEDDEYNGIKIKVPTTVFDKDGLPKFTKNRQQRYWSIFLNKLAGGSFTDENGKPLPDMSKLRLRFMLANDKAIADEQAYADDINPFQKEELKKRGLSVDESGKVFISNKTALNKFLKQESYGSYLDTEGNVVDLTSDEDKTVIDSLISRENGTVDDNKSRLTISEFDILFKYKIADNYSKREGDEVVHFTDESFNKGTFINGTGMYVTITDTNGTEYYFDLANNKFTTDKSKLKSGDFDQILTTMVRPSSIKRMQLHNSLATYIYKNSFGGDANSRITIGTLTKILKDGGISNFNINHKGQSYNVSLSDILDIPDSFVTGKLKYDDLTDIQKILFEIAEDFVIDNISNEYKGRRSIKKLLKDNPDTKFISKSPILITQGNPLHKQDKSLLNITGKPDSAVSSPEDIESYIVHILGNKSTVSSWGDSIDSLFDKEPYIKAGKGKRGRVYLKTKNKTVIEGVTRNLNDSEAQLVIDMFGVDYTGFVNEDSKGAKKISEVRDEAGNRISLGDTYLTMWPGNEFAKSMIQKIIFFQRKANEGTKRNNGTFVIGLDDNAQNSGSRKLYVYYGVDGKISLNDLKSQTNKVEIDKFKTWLKSRPLNLLNGIAPDKNYFHPIGIKKDVSGEPILIVKKFDAISDTNKIHPYVAYMTSEKDGKTVLQTDIVPNESYYNESERLKGKGQQVSNRYVIIDNGAMSVDNSIQSEGGVSTITPTILTQNNTNDQTKENQEQTELSNPDVSKSVVINSVEDKINGKVIKTVENTLSDNFIITDLKENVPYVITTKEVNSIGTKINAKITILRKGNDISIVDHNYNAVKTDGTVLNKEALDGAFKEMLYGLKTISLSLFVSTPSFIKYVIVNNLSQTQLSNIKNGVITEVKKSFEQIKNHDFQFSMEITYQDKITEDLPISLEQQDINSGLFSKLQIIENQVFTSDNLDSLITQLNNLSNLAKSTEFKNKAQEILKTISEKLEVSKLVEEKKPDISKTFTSGSLADFLEHIELRTALEPILAKIYTSWNTIPLSVNLNGNFIALGSEQLNTSTLTSKRSITIGNKFISEDKTDSSRKIIHEVVHTVTLAKLNSYYKDPSKVSDKVKEGVEKLIQVRNDYLRNLANRPTRISEDNKDIFIFGYSPEELNIDKKDYRKAIRDGLMKWSKGLSSDKTSNEDINTLFDLITKQIELSNPMLSNEEINTVKKHLSENVTEFIAGIFENKALREDLSKITSPRSSTLESLLTELVNVIKTYFLSLGDSLSPEEYSLLNEAINAAEDIIKETELFKKDTVEEKVITPDTSGFSMNSSALNSLEEEGESAYPSSDSYDVESDSFNSDLLDVFSVVFSENYENNDTQLDKDFDLIKSLFNISEESLFNLEDSLKYFTGEKEISNDKTVIQGLFNLLSNLPVVHNEHQGISKIFEMLESEDGFNRLTNEKDKALLLIEKIKEYIYQNDSDIKVLAQADSIYENPSFLNLFNQIRDYYNIFNLNKNFVNETYKILQLPLPNSTKTNIMKYFNPLFVDKNDNEIEVPEVFIMEIMDALDYFTVKKLVNSENLTEGLDSSLTNQNLSNIYISSFNEIQKILERSINNLTGKQEYVDRLNNIQHINELLKVSKNRDALLASHISTRLNSFLPKINLDDTDIEDLLEGDYSKDSAFEESSERDVSESIPGIMKIILSSVPKKKKLSSKVSLTPEQEKQYNTLLNDFRKFRDVITQKRESDVVEKSKEGRFILNKQGFEQFTYLKNPYELIQNLVNFLPKNDTDTIRVLSSLLNSKYKKDQLIALSREKLLESLINSSLDKVINRLNMLVTNKIASVNMIDDNSLLLSLPKLENFKRVWNYIARRSSSLPNDYDVFFNERLSQIINDEFGKEVGGMYGLADIQKIMSDYSDLSDPYNFSVRASMTQAFAKYEMTNYIVTLDNSGLINLVDANLNREVQDIRAAWESNYIERLRNFNINFDKTLKLANANVSGNTLNEIRKGQSYADLIVSPFYIQKLKDILKEAEANRSDSNKAIELVDSALQLLGISVSNPKRLITNYRNIQVAGAPGFSSFVTRFKLAIDALDQASKIIDPELPEDTPKRSFVNIVSNSATSGFMAELIKYQMNEQNEFITNQFQNAEGRTVYALQLMHSLTNTASNLNYYGTSEELLRENMPQLFNRFSGYIENNKFVPTSIILNNVLSEQQKTLNVVSLNGARDDDNNSKITSNLSPGELLSTRIKHITSGVYLINQAADRKVVNGITLTDQNNKPSVLFNNIGDALYQFRKYLLNELNSILNDAGEDIIFYKDKRKNLRFFDDIIKKNTLGRKIIDEFLKEERSDKLITFEELNSYEYIDEEGNTVLLKDLIDESVKSYFAKEVEELYKRGVTTGIFDSTTTRVVFNNGEPERVHLGKKEKIKIVKDNKTGANKFSRFIGKDLLQHSETEVVTTFNFPIGIGHELWTQYKGTKNWVLDGNITNNDWDNTIKQILTSVVFNQAAAYVEQAIVFTGDPAVYKNLSDMYKRIAMHNSPKKTAITGKMVNAVLKNNSDLILYKKPDNVDDVITEVKTLTKDEVRDYIKGKYKVPKNHFLKAQSGFRVDRYMSDIDSFDPDLVKTVVTDDVWSISSLAYDKVKSVEIVNGKVHYKDADKKIISDEDVSQYRKAFTEMFLKSGVINAINLHNKVEAYISPYLKLEESNAIGLITLSEYRTLFMRSGTDWTKKHEKAYVKAISGKVLSLSEMQLFQPIKSQYSGPLYEYLNAEDKTVNGDFTRLNIPTGYKHMLMPLIPSAIKGTYYEKVMRHMDKNGIGILQFISGNKYGTRLKEKINSDTGEKSFKLNELLSENEKSINSNFDSWKTQSIMYKYFGIQVDNKPKLKKKQRVSTQGRKTILLNSKNFGEAVDPTLEKLVNEYVSVNNVLVENNWEDFEKQLGVYFDSQSNSSKIGNLEYLIKILLEQEKDRGANINTLASILSMLENPEMKIENTMSPAKVQNVLMALVRNRVLKDRRKGESLAQVPVSGFDKIFRGKHETGLMDRSSELAFYRKGKDGTTIPAQIMIPYPSDWNKWLLNLGNNDLTKGLEVLNNMLQELQDKLYTIRETDNKDKVELTSDEENLLNLTTIIGFRIPNQGFSSNEVFEIKKFLPAEHGALVVMPSEIVAKNGSDFDFDKNNTYIPNWIINKKTGKPEYVSYDSFTENHYKRYIRNIKRDLNKNDEFAKSKMSEIHSLSTKIKQLISSKNSVFNYLENIDTEASDVLLNLKEITNQIINNPEITVDDVESDLDVLFNVSIIDQIAEAISENPDKDSEETLGIIDESLQELNQLIKEISKLVKEEQPNLLSDYNKYIEANSLSFADYKKEFKENPLRYSDTEMLENYAIDLQKNILTHPVNFGHLLSPVDDSILKGKEMGDKKDYHPGIVWKIRMFKNFNNPEYSSIAEEYRSKIRSGEDKEKTLNDSLTKFIKLYSKNNDSGSLSGALLVSQNLDKFNAFLVGKRNIGAVARHITSLSNSQRSNLFINTPMIIEINQSTGKPYVSDNANIYFESNWVVDINNSGNVVHFKEDPYKITIPENEVYENGVFIGYKNTSGEIVLKPNSRIYPSLGGITTSSNERISDVLSAFLTAYVDVAKDPYIFDMNGGTATVHTYATMLRQGASLEFTSLLMNQEVVSTYLKNQAANETLLRKIHDLDTNKDVIVISSLAEHISSIEKLISTKDWYQMSISERREKYVNITSEKKLQKGNRGSYTTNYWKSVAFDPNADENSPIDPKKERAFWDNYDIYMSAYKSYAKKKNKALYKLKYSHVSNVKRNVFDINTRIENLSKGQLENIHTSFDTLGWSEKEGVFTFADNADIYKQLYKDGKLSVEALEEYLVFGIPEDQKEMINFALLDLFLEYQRNAVELNRAMNAASFDTFGTPKSVLGLYNYNLNHVRTANLEYFGNYDAMMSDTIIKPFKEIFGKTEELFSQLLFVNPSENFWPGIMMLVNKVNSNLPYDEHEDSYNEVVYEFMNFLLHYDFQDGYGKAIDTVKTYRNLILGFRNNQSAEIQDENSVSTLQRPTGAKSLPKLVNDLKTNKYVKDGFTDLLANNSFIKALSIRDVTSLDSVYEFFQRREVDNSRFTNPVLMIFTRKMTPNEVNNLILGFKDIKNITKLLPKGHPYKTLYTDLIDFCIACYGINPNANNSYYQFIPKEDLVNKMSLTLQRFRNHVKGNQFVPFDDTKLDSFDDEFFSNLNNNLNNLMIEFHDQFWRRYSKLPKKPKERSVYNDDGDGGTYETKESSANEWMSRNFEIPYAIKYKPLGDGKFVKSIVKGEITTDNNGKAKRVFGKESEVFIGSKTWVGYNPEKYDDYIEDAMIVDEEQALLDAMIIDQNEVEDFDKKDPSYIKLVTSGKATGTDRFFVGQLIIRGVNPNNIIEYTTASYSDASDELKAEMDDKYLKAITALNRIFSGSSSEGGKLMRRNWLQVKNVDNVVAVGNILKPGQNSRRYDKVNKRYYTNDSGKQTIDGGTGVTVEMAIQANKNVFVFHEGSLNGNTTNKGWYQWDYNSSSFVRLSKPMSLPDNFAAVGTRHINKTGESAIITLLNKEFGQPKQGIINPYPTYDSVPKQITDEQTGVVQFPALGSIALNIIKDLVFELKAVTTLRTKEYSNQFYKTKGVYNIYNDPGSRQVQVDKLGTVKRNGDDNTIIFTRTDGIRFTWTQDELAVKEGFEDWEDFKANVHYDYTKKFVNSNMDVELDIYSVKPINANLITIASATDGRAVYTGYLNKKEDLPTNGVAVFGSNGIGVQDSTRPAGGAASIANKNGWVKNGEVMIDKYSENGKSWGLYTVTEPGAKTKIENRRTIEEIKRSVDILYNEAINSPDKKFFVMYTDKKGNNGHDPLVFASAFYRENIPSNIIFNDKFYNLILRYRENLLDIAKKKDSEFSPISAYDEGQFSYATTVERNPSIEKGFYEVSSEGDSRFSAMSAYVTVESSIQDIHNNTIVSEKKYVLEELYQFDVKGNNNASDRKSEINLIKNELISKNQPVSDTIIANELSKIIRRSVMNSGVKGSMINPEKLQRLIEEGKLKDDSNTSQLQYLWDKYLTIWEKWASQNPELINELAVTLSKFNLKLNDKFTKTGSTISQARALTNILNRLYENNKPIELGNLVKVKGLRAVQKLEKVRINNETKDLEYGVRPRKSKSDSDILYYPLSSVTHYNITNDSTEDLENQCD